MLRRYYIVSFVATLLLLSFVHRAIHAQQPANSRNALRARVFEIHTTSFSIVRAFQRDNRSDAFRELELVDDQAQVIRDLVKTRFESQLHDLREAEALKVKVESDSGRRFVQEVNRREVERERNANEVLKKTLLDFQQRELGELVVAHFGLDVLGTPFAQQVLKVSEKQAADLQHLQRRMDQAGKQFYKNNPALNDPKVLQELANLSSEVFRILDRDQLEKYFKFRGKLREGDTLSDFLNSLPPAYRQPAELAIQARVDAEEKDH